MSKITSPDWPDPSDWLRRLHERLDVIGEDYLAASWEAADDPESFEGLNFKQSRAAEALIVIYSALKELPPFERSKGAAVLHDVAGALRDVVVGGTPRLFASVRPGSPGGDGIHRNYVKIFVVLAVRLLVDAQDVAEPRAIETVATIFANAGATGRKGKPLSPSTVREWCNKVHPLAANPDEAQVSAEVEQRLEEIKALSGWPGTYEQAIYWIKQTASDPLLASKYG